ncbi:MAG TPA: O-methyltransferase [Tepidisphaeraceae bacterium]|nr:O-methyltransferase [Tepidisphaeraceae bacterium]
MKESTAKFISYDLRPAKQAERRILMDFLKCANEAGLTVSDCRYVGMGGTMFYDFHLMHRFLGVKRMISLERDPDTHPRSIFNCPFDFITVENRTVAEFLAADDDDAKTIYWLDYDDGINPEITADITALGARVKVGGFAFLTAYAEPPGALQKQTKEQRLEYFQQNMGDFSVGLTADEMENSEFPKTVHRVLVAAFKNAFSARTDGQFQILFQVQYKDSKPMVTVGGCFCENDAVPTVLKRVKADLPFLLRDPPYKIPHLNLTERERAVFDMAVTKRRSNSKQSNSLKALGFRKRDFDAYRDMIRFLPRYHESII